MRLTILLIPSLLALVSAQTGAPTGAYSNSTTTAPAVSTGYTTATTVVGGKTTSVLVNGAGQTTSFGAGPSPTASLQGSDAQAGRSGNLLGLGGLFLAAVGGALVL